MKPDKTVVFKREKYFFRILEEKVLRAKINESEKFKFLVIENS